MLRLFSDNSVPTQLHTIVTNFHDYIFHMCSPVGSQLAFEINVRKYPTTLLSAAWLWSLQCLSILSFTADRGSAALYTTEDSERFIMNCDIDGMSMNGCLIREVICNHVVMCSDWTSVAFVSGDMENRAEMEEKTRLINQVLELQHTLEGNTHTLFEHNLQVEKFGLMTRKPPQIID